MEQLVITSTKNEKRAGEIVNALRETGAILPDSEVTVVLRRGMPKRKVDLVDAARIDDGAIDGVTNSYTIVK